MAKDTATGSVYSRAYLPKSQNSELRVTRLKKLLKLCQRTFGSLSLAAMEAAAATAAAAAAAVASRQQHQHRTERSRQLSKSSSLNSQARARKSCIIRAVSIVICS
eukprot:4236849-Pleurochrysis_carterae.AAC.7